MVLCKHCLFITFACYKYRQDTITHVAVHNPTYKISWENFSSKVRAGYYHRAQL